MFGSEYSNEPQLLLSSFGEMSSSYKGVKKKKSPFVMTLFYRLYIFLFGIPEIGFQIRSMYFKNIIESKLLGRKINSIFDAGSGIGIYTFWLSKKFPKAHVLGGDIEEEKLAFCKKRAKENSVSNISFEYKDVTKKSTKRNVYDLIVSIDVLEHIEDYKGVLKNFSNILTPRGYLFLHTPQPEQKRIFKSMKHWSHDGHVHEGYTPQQLEDELTKLGFKIVERKETFGYFGKFAWESNHVIMKKSLLLAGLTYPFLYLLSRLDWLTVNRHGLGTAILAKKIK